MKYFIAGAVAALALFVNTESASAHPPGYVYGYGGGYSSFYARPAVSFGLNVYSTPYYGNGLSVYSAPVYTPYYRPYPVYAAPVVPFYGYGYNSGYRGGFGGYPRFYR